MTVLSAEGLEVRRGGRAILDRLSLRLHGGSFVALVGANGAGKSTLLAVLAGLLAPQAGEVRLDGRPLSGIPRRELARRRAYLPQGPRAEWPISVERLVALGLTPDLPPFGELPVAMAERVAAAVADADLVDHREQPVTTLSGGELARAMLARALVGDPALLLVDEPLAGLDPRHALDGMRRLRSLADSGTLVVAALHDLTLAARFATEIAVLVDGRLLACGPTATVLTSDLVSRAFDVEARVSQPGTPAATVDFVAQNRARTPP